MAGGAGRTWRRWTAGSLGLAVAARLITGPLPLNYYDIGYALVWGREIIHGHLPAYQTPGASTPHPLGTLLATVAAVFGTPGSWYAVEAIIFLSFGVAGAALFALTRASLRRALPEAAARSPASEAAGALAVGALLLSPPFLTDALGGSGLSDLPAAALVLAAAVLAAERPDRDRAPLALLGLAGLMRPEAWGLAAAYWLYLAHRRPSLAKLLESALLVAAAPVLWALADLVVVGDPTYSLTHTQAASHTGMFAHGLGQVPRATLRGLRALTGLPVLLIGGVGAAAALVLARRATAAPLALLALTLGEFAALGAADVPLLERFLLVPAALICLFFALILLGGHQAIRDRIGPGSPWPGRAWAALCLLIVLYVAATHLRGAVRVRSDQRTAVHAQADLVSLAARPDVRRALRRCPPLYVPRFTLTSLAAVDFDLPPQTILRTPARPPATGLILVPATGDAGRYFGLTGARLRTLRLITARPARPVGQNRSWRLFARGCPGP